MRQLHACDFCGADPAGVYEVVPESLAPTEDEQRRVALCPDCRDTLESLLSPLIARLDGSEPTSSKPASNSATDPAPDPEPEPLAEPTPEPEAEEADAPETETDNAPESETDDAQPSSAEREAARREAMRTAPRADRPEGYEKVMRLLGNREGAMPRDDLETLVTNAYGLDARGFDAVVDAALENGDLEEGKRGLRTT